MANPNPSPSSNVNGEDDRTWDHEKFGPANLELLSNDYCFPVTFRGKNSILMFTHEGSMARVEITMENPEMLLEIATCTSKKPVSQHQGSKFYWTKCRSEIYAISIGFRERDPVISSIVVFKFDPFGRSWNIVDSCPNAAFFIGPSEDQTISCPVPPPDSSRAGNKVYIVRRSISGKREKLLLYTYHIQQRTLSVTLLETTTPTSNQFKNCYWVLSHVAQEARVEVVKKESTYRKSNVPNGCKRRKISGLQDAMFNHDLPEDTLRTISSYLIRPVDYLNFRAVYPCLGSAKDWRGRILADERLSPHPWLIKPHLEKQDVYCMVDPATNTDYLMMKTPESWEKDSWIRASSNGWLLVSSTCEGIQKLRLKLYNPLTKSTINLPDSNIVDHFYFSSYGCKIVGVGNLDHYIDLDYYEMRWVKRRVQKEISIGKVKVQVQQSNVNAVYVEGRFHFLLDHGRIGVVDDEDPTLLVWHMRCPCSSFERSFLVKWGGDLLSIFISREWKRGLKVFKMNGSQSKRGWERVHHLDDNNVYLSNASSIVTKAESPELGNRIYFSRFYQGSVVYFSMHTNKFHYGDGQVMSSCYGSEEQLYGCWFQPNWDNRDQFSDYFFDENQYCE